MHMPNVHACAQLSTENEQLKKKLRKIKQENVNLQRELNDLKDRLRMEAMMKDFVTTRNMETQTDPPKVMNTLVRPEKKKEDPAEQKVNQLLSMHNGLMKRYEKELKTNMQHIETITNLNLKLNEAEQKLRESQMKTRQLEMEKESVQRPPEPAPLPDDDRPVHQLLKEIKKERDRYRDERDNHVVNW